MSYDQEREVIRTDYLTTRRPCWLCSKQLYRMPGNGPRAGRYMATIRKIDGHERQTHLNCHNDGGEE